VWGVFPLHEAAFIGGATTLRGFSWNRFAGDASAFGSAELSFPLTRITLLTSGHLGVTGFSDAGRVWLDSESAGDWHTSAGAAVWFNSLGHSLTLTYAQGEQDRMYLTFGSPF
jgi:hemolysin activation/secretion protein